MNSEELKKALKKQSRVVAHIPLLGDIEGKCAEIVYKRREHTLRADQKAGEILVSVGIISDKANSILYAASQNVEIKKRSPRQAP